MRCVLPLGTLMVMSLCVTSGAAQVSSEGEVRREVSFLRLGSSGEGERVPVYRLYAEDVELRIRLSFLNHSGGELLFDQNAVRRTTVVVIAQDGAEIQTFAQWNDGVLVPDDHGGLRTATGDEPLPPTIAPSWNISVRRRDGRPFEAGEYTVIVHTPPVASVVRWADGKEYKGAGLHGPWELRLRIGPAATKEERVKQYRIAAYQNLMDRAFDEAIDAFMTLSAEVPDDATVLLELGAAYSLAGRFNEAIGVLEPALAIVDEITRVKEMELLARAYLGARDEGNARRVLRERGYTPGNVDTVLEGLRDSLEQQDRKNARIPGR